MSKIGDSKGVMMRTRTLLLVLGGSSIWLACSPDAELPTPPSEPLQQELFDKRLVDGPAESIAAALAVALRDGELRQRLLEDLRDSPFPRHRIELGTYLEGVDGASIKDAASSTFADGPSDLESALAALPSMVLEVPSTYQQVTWEGLEMLQVIGSQLTLRDRLRAESLKAFTPEGRTVAVGPDEFLETPTLVVFPSETDFGANPEQTRRAAPTRDRPTIAARQYERQEPAASREEGGVNDPSSHVETTGEMWEAFDGGGMAALGPPLSRTFSYNDCVNPSASDDDDYDDFDDDCERDLVDGFAPRMQVTNENYLSREEHWSLRKGSGAYQLKIHYMYSYHDDGGVWGFGEHKGDSEFVEMWITGKGSKKTWYLEQVTLSAHWGSVNDHTETYQANQISYAGARPKVWISHNKHGNYRTEIECDLAWFDECDTGPTSDFVALGYRNIGNDIYQNSQPVGWLIVNQSSSQGYPGSENFWQGVYFDGWHSSGDQTGGYKASLYAYGHKQWP